VNPACEYNREDFCFGGATLTHKESNMNRNPGFRRRFACVATMLALVSLAATPAVLPGQQTETENTGKPVPLREVDGKTVCQLAPENTRIEFVGTHVGDDPKPRLGGFGKFSGTITVADDKPQSIQVDMEITSIWTEFDNLTKHLMTADFFEAAKFPRSQFRSTSITLLGEGKCLVSGQLTLHGTTREIEFPATFRLADEGLLLGSEFTLDRTQFGMDKMTDGVEARVSLKVEVGEATRGVESRSGNGSDSGEESAEDDPAVEGVTVTVWLPNMT
jgi:polyisoprenoid-binding protein YceI